jgi:hypothetical protein
VAPEVCSSQQQQKQQQSSWLLHLQLYGQSCSIATCTVQVRPESW